MMNSLRCWAAAGGGQESRLLGHCWERLGLDVLAVSRQSLKLRWGQEM